MGLDAHVFCDCYEKGRLIKPPPAGISLKVEPDGSLSGDTDGMPLEILIEFDAWREQNACEHRGGTVLHHRLGNIALIALLRSEISREPARFQILLQKVLYNGIHAGDYLPLELFPALEKEVAQLAHFRCHRSRMTMLIQQRWPGFGTRRYFLLPSSKADHFLQGFRIQMEQLLETGLRFQKPIAF